jgi:putative FmdB family regulatory protein
MPTYGYRCSRGHHFEVLQRINDAPLTVCPECGAPITRIVYPVGVIFKGQGFYKTDSRGSSTIEPGKTEDVKPKAAEKPASKPAAKPAEKPVDKPTEEKTGT